MYTAYKSMYVSMSYRNSVVDTGGCSGQLKLSLKECAPLISDNGSCESKIGLSMGCVLYKEVRSSTG